MFNEKVIFKQSKQLLDIPILLIILFLVEVHFDISGNDIKFDISGKDINELHSENISYILLELEVSKFDISWNDINDWLSKNIKIILSKLEVSNFDISGSNIIDLQV